MSLDPDAFRAVMGRFASGVTIVTAIDADGTAHGMTVSAFSSLSLSPPLVVVCIDEAASMYDVLATCEHFAVNILASTQERIARRFADTGAQRFEGI
jgi:flavin reductase (DIM6/NTAB) family NADH-FMN oxidoreductase RutF